MAPIACIHVTCHGGKLNFELTSLGLYGTCKLCQPDNVSQCLGYSNTASMRHNAIAAIASRAVQPHHTPCAVTAHGSTLYLWHNRVPVMAKCCLLKDKPRVTEQSVQLQCSMQKCRQRVRPLQHCCATPRRMVLTRHMCTSVAHTLSIQN